MSKFEPSFTILVGTSGKIITVDGNMFNYRTNNGLFLSSNILTADTAFYNLYSDTRSVSAANPPFSAFPVHGFEVNNNNVLSFKLPAFYEPRHLDIIFANDAGYTLASSGKRFTYISIVSAL
jgi:hypothetical protein